MQGDWACVSMTRDGTEFPSEAVQALFRTVKGEEYSVFRWEKPIGKGSFKIDATQKPKTIDLIPAAAKGKPATIQGIYEFDGEKLKLCYGAPGQPRPKEFKAPQGSMLTVFVWEREKK